MSLAAREFLLLLLLPLANAAAGGAAPANQPAARPDDVVAAVSARHDAIVAAAEALDVDALFRHVADNDEGALVLNGRLLLTRREALETTRANYRGIKSVRYEIRERHVTPLAPGAAVLVAAGMSHVTLDDGRTFSRAFVHTVVFALQHGAWQVVHSHHSNPPPG